MKQKFGCKLFGEPKRENGNWNKQFLFPSVIYILREVGEKWDEITIKKIWLLFGYGLGIYLERF